VGGVADLGARNPGMPNECGTHTDLLGAVNLVFILLSFQQNLMILIEHPLHQLFSQNIDKKIFSKALYDIGNSFAFPSKSMKSFNLLSGE
jgi:hypothetical protein